MSTPMTCFLNTCTFEASTSGGPLKSCARCRVALYCSSECQHKDWPNHQAICRFAACFVSHTLPELFTFSPDEARIKMKKAAGEWYDANTQNLRQMAWQKLPSSFLSQSLNDEFLWVDLKKNDLSKSSNSSVYKMSSAKVLPISALDGLPTVMLGGQDILKGEIRRAISIREQLRLSGRELRLVVVVSSEDSILIPGAEIFSESSHP
ncbi:hypothetical protein CPB83DRAFT_900281 [Crepidotus variabilis]|uniref:MYND-type domain-containing protein n=1 Tax=Crepidotus variabilis TaxID=179855 RepID=A0A9P6E3G8_9AGAR|nr:hypothetical protein CPB83DRAFT_900281 [Crepidotus variabilis]